MTELQGDTEPPDGTPEAVVKQEDVNGTEEAPAVEVIEVEQVPFSLLQRSKQKTDERISSDKDEDGGTNDKAPEQNMTVDKQTQTNEHELPHSFAKKTEHGWIEYFSKPGMISLERVED